MSDNLVVTKGMIDAAHGLKISRLSRAMAAFHAWPITRHGYPNVFQELAGACIERGWDGEIDMVDWARATIEREDTL